MVVKTNMLESTSTDTAQDTRRQAMVSETSISVVTGLEKLILKQDSSSSELNPTGIVHLAHSITRVIPSTLLLTETPEFTSTESSTGNHQPSNGKIRLRELHIIDTAFLT